jgi:hypothetical protein
LRNAATSRRTKDSYLHVLKTGAASRKPLLSRRLICRRSRKP